MKDQLQVELKEKVKEGIKPSDLRKLKKSKSLNDLPTIPKSPPLKHSHSTTDIPLLEPTELEDKISVLELKLETKDRELEDKEETIKDFRKAFQKADEEIKKTKQELDNSLEVRHQTLKALDKVQAELKQTRKELAENVEEFSNKLISQDNLIANLRTENSKLQLEKESLQRDLNLAQKLAQMRKVPYPNSDHWDYGKYALISIATVTLIIWLLRTN